ncbi:MAG: hypothetical protein LBN11_07235 [Tannerella sp.]|jgi:hypothetical protein|nr:hypothetical protein [Tannerella sp.]
MTHLESRINLIKELCIPSKDDGYSFTRSGGFALLSGFVIRHTHNRANDC